MKKFFKKKLLENQTNLQKKMTDDVNERTIYAASHDVDEVYKLLDSSKIGLNQEQVEKSREIYGSNEITKGKDISLGKKLFDAFINPFTAILLILALVSLFTDVIWASPGERSYMTVIIITTMVMISGIMKFVQETRSGNAAKELNKMIHTTTLVERMGVGKKEIPLDEVVVGDIIYLSSGDIIPADLRVCYAKDLFVSQSALTGESEPVEKYSEVDTSEETVLNDKNMIFMGSNVVSGSAKAIVVSNGDDTIFGRIAKGVQEEPIETSFDKGVSSVSWLLIRYMLIMVPIVFFVNGFTKGDWLHALLFAISIAVGLTPEMLPMIVTTCLAKGAVSMSKEKVIIKSLNSIQNLGSIDILCTDKTGTLTQDKVILEYPLDIMGEEDLRVLKHGFLNSYYQTGLKNLMDIAIINRTHSEQESHEGLRGLDSNYLKVDEIPFDFERRRMSVVVKDKNQKTQMITKGAIEEMLKISSYCEYKGHVIELDDEHRELILNKVNDLNSKGLRVLGVAQKNNPSKVGEFSVKDENDMVLIGYLAFLDPPKESTEDAIEALHEYGVDVKILTGDNEKVTLSICKQVGLDVKKLLLGSDVEKMSDEELAKEVEKTTVFAKLSPMQKARVVETLRANGHTVGYMGDGINDAPAMKVADVGISVDTAVDIAKESADVILLEKDLMVLERGIIEGRKTYANMIKYIKMTASSNFGNMFSVLAASAFLPFLPMEPIHLILLNLIYDISCTAIPWDNVDEDFLKRPREWDSSSISSFMKWIGPISSIFDIATYLVMFFIICPQVIGAGYYQITDPAMKAQFIALFQAGWFIESMWSQTLVIHLIRTPKVPFVESRASFSVTVLTIIGIIVATIIPFTGLGEVMGFAILPSVYFLWLGGIVLAYILLTSVMKKVYINKFGELL